MPMGRGIYVLSPYKQVHLLPKPAITKGRTKKTGAPPAINPHNCKR